MKNILELLYGLPRGKTHRPDSPFARTAHIKSENPDFLSTSMAEWTEGKGDVL